MKILAIIVSIYLVLCILLFVLQDRLIFFPEKLSSDHQFKFAYEFEEKIFQINESTKIHALHFFSKIKNVESEKTEKDIILYFHGNAGSLEGWGQVAEDFVELGYDVLILDYRGYGKSTGENSEATFYEDAQLVYDFLLEKYKASNIIIYGRSLGTVVAVDLASKNNPKQLILETPISNFPQMAQDKFKIFPVKLLLKYRFRNDLKINNINCPIHIFHGTNDSVVPYQQSQELVRLLNDETILTTIPKGNHNNLGQFSLYWNKIKEIL